MKKIICVILAIICIVGTVSAQASLDTTLYNTPPYNPPTGMHPRVFFTADRISEIKANIEAEENELAKETLLKAKEKDLASSNYLPSLFAAVEANAFCYVIYGDEEAGKKAAGAIEILKSKKEAIASQEGDDKTRNAGRLVNVLAEVYDWCYYLLSDTQKEEIITNL